MHRRIISILCIIFLLLVVALGCSANQVRKESAPVTPETKVESGRYMGQIDSNSIEIKIGDVPEEKTVQVFRLSEEIKKNFANYGLNTGDEVSFTYIPPQQIEQPTIIEIKKINK